MYNRFVHKGEISSSFANLKQLSIGFCKNITTIPEELIHLTYIEAHASGLKKIPNTLLNLTILDCSFTNVKEIPNTLINLNHLSCFSSYIKEIPKELISLNYLNCRDCNITVFPKELVNLSCLFIGGKTVTITNIPTLPLLSYLNCRNCKFLVNIPYLPNLSTLKCDGCTRLLDIPRFLPKLEYISCEYSQLYKFPIIVKNGCFIKFEINKEINEKRYLYKHMSEDKCIIIEQFLHTKRTDNFETYKQKYIIDKRENKFNEAYYAPEGEGAKILFEKYKNGILLTTA